MADARPATTPVADDDDEWEYDYSATETETYYLTVELSYPEFKGTATRNPHHSRGGYYKKWLAEPRGTTAEATPAPARARSIRPETSRGTVERSSPVPAAADVDPDMEAIDPSLRGDGGNPDTTTGPTQNDSDVEREPDQDDGAPHDDTEAPAQGGHDDDGELEPTSDIQILDLHSDNPIISHRGHVFEGSWAEMVGTEVLLAPHEGDDGRGSLPALRHLPGDVDLLGASASRILTKRKTLHPRKPAEDSLAPTQREWNINIPVGKNKHGERAQQANFLEKLIALKIQRGDKDQVTVYAKDGVGKDFHDDRDPDFRPRRKRVRIRLDDEDDDGDEEHGGRPVARSGGTAAGQLARGAGSSQRSDADVLSVPTPKRWSDLEAGAGDEDEEEDEDDEMDQDGDGAQDEDEDVDDQDDDEEEDDDDDHELGDDTTMQAG